MEKSSLAAAAAAGWAPASAEDAPSKFFMLRRPEFKFSELPKDIIDEIDKRVINARDDEFCHDLLSVAPKSEMPYAEFIQRYSEFEKRVKTFIKRIKYQDEGHKPAHGDIDPRQPNGCWFFVLDMCVFVLKEILLHRNANDFLDEDQLRELKDKVDWLREIIMHHFAQNGINIIHKMLKEGLNDSKVLLILNTIKWVVNLCFFVLKANIEPSYRQLFETRAVLLLEECSNIFVTILQNEDISLELKKKTLTEFYNMMTLMYSLFKEDQDRDVLLSQVQLFTRVKYNQLKIIYKAVNELVKKNLQKQGGNSQMRSKNKSKRRNDKNKKNNKKNKNIKKTLRLRIKK